MKVKYLSILFSFLGLIIFSRSLAFAAPSPTPIKAVCPMIACKVANPGCFFVKNPGECGCGTQICSTPVPSFPPPAPASIVPVPSMTPSPITNCNNTTNPPRPCQQGYTCQTSSSLMGGNGICVKNENTICSQTTLQDCNATPNGAWCSGTANGAINKCFPRDRAQFVNCVSSEKSGEVALRINEACAAVPQPTGYPTMKPSPIFLGDVNHDRKVDQTDYDLMVRNFGNVAYDLNKDGVMDIFDFNLVITNFGKFNN